MHMIDSQKLQQFRTSSSLAKRVKRQQIKHLRTCCLNSYLASNLSLKIFDCGRIFAFRVFRQAIVISIGLKEKKKINI